MKNIFGKKSVMILLLVLLFKLTWMGCSSTVKERRDEPVKPLSQWCSDRSMIVPHGTYLHARKYPSWP